MKNDREYSNAESMSRYPRQTTAANDMFLSSQVTASLYQYQGILGEYIHTSVEAIGHILRINTLDSQALWTVPPFNATLNFTILSPTCFGHNVSFGVCMLSLIAISFFFNLKHISDIYTLYMIYTLILGLTFMLFA